MASRLATSAILFILAASALLPAISAAGSAGPSLTPLAGSFLAAATPANGTAVKLGVYPTPASLVPQASSSGEVTVQLQDANGNPAAAPFPVNVTLASSRTDIANVTSSLTIPQGRTYGIANSSASFGTGVATITASSTGLATGFAQLAVVGPKPSKLSVVVAPGVVAAGSTDLALVAVQLQGPDGTPAPAPAPVVVVVTSSATTVGTILTPSFTIPIGKSFGTCNFLAGIPGLVNVTAQAQGLASGTFSVNVRTQVSERYGAPINGTHGALSLYLGTPSVLNDRSQYPTIAVQLQNNSAGSGAMGIPLTAKSDVTVFFSSSITPVGTVPIGSVPGRAVIPAGHSFVILTLTSTLAVGSTTVTAAASNFTSDFKSVTSAGPAPFKLAVLSPLPMVVADGGTYSTTAVQLQDSLGNPAKAPADIVVTLASSNPSVGNVDQATVIPSGKTHVFFQFQSASSSGASNITASASGYVSGQGKIVAAYLPMSGVISAGTLSPSSLTAVRFGLNLTSGATPLAGASVQWPANSKQMSVVNSTKTTDSAGSAYAYILFQDSGNLTVSATVQKSGFGQLSFSLKVTVKPQVITIVLIPGNTFLNETQPTDITAQVSAKGKPLPNVLISWSTDVGVMNPPSSTTDASGTSKSIFVSPTNGTANVKASVTLPGYAPALQTTQITVSTGTGSSGGGGGGSPSGPLGLLLGNLMYIVVILVVLILVLFIVRRRRKKGKAARAKAAGEAEGAKGAAKSDEDET